MSNISLISLFFLSSLLLLIHCDEPKPDMVVVLARHGAREPLSAKYDNTWDSPMNLMDIGAEQHFALGTILSKKYSHLVQGMTPREIYLQSTESVRTTMSVSAELFGLFQDQVHNHTSIGYKRDFSIPFEDEALVKEVTEKLSKSPEMMPNRNQLLTIKVLPDAKEDLLQVDPANCRAIKNGQQRRVSDAANRQMGANLQSTISALRRLGHKISTITDLKEFGDAVMNRHIAGKPDFPGVPAGSSVFNDSIFALKWWNIYNLVGTELERALRVYPIHKRLVEWFSFKTVGQNPLKFALLGAQESTIFPFLSLYNITEHQCVWENYQSESAGKPIPHPDCVFPEYASQLIYEFYNNSGNPYIRMLYNGRPRRLCRYSEGVECGLNQFIAEMPEVLNGMTDQSHARDCGVAYRPVKGFSIPVVSIPASAPSIPATPENAKPVSSGPNPSVITQKTGGTGQPTIYAENIQENSKVPEKVESQDESIGSPILSQEDKNDNPDLSQFRVKTPEEIDKHTKDLLHKYSNSESLKNIAKDSLIVWLIVAVAVLGTIFTFIIFLLISGKLVIADNTFKKELQDTSNMIDTPKDTKIDIKRTNPAGQEGEDEDISEYGEDT